MRASAQLVRLSDTTPEGGPHALIALLRSAEDRIRRDTAVLIRPEASAEGVITVGHTVVYPGCTTRGHAHDDREEVYIVVRGRGTVVVGDEAFEVRADDVVYIPPGPAHTTRNPHPVPLEYYWITVARGAVRR
jgi:mannose-6-phosphate isomerase-like protein (cupin superfamily)